MLAVFFLFPQSEQVYVSVSVFKVQSGVTLLLQSLCRECQHCSGALVIRLASPPDPECTQAMLGLCWVWGFFLSTAQQASQISRTIVYLAKLMFFFRVHNSTTACEGLEEVALLVVGHM